MRILFWNLNRKESPEEVQALVSEHEPEFVVFAEDPLAGEPRLANLNNGAEYQSTFSVCERVQLYTTSSLGFVTVTFENEYYSIRQVQLSGHVPFLLVLAHWKSLLHRAPTSQSHSLIPMAQKIRDAEGRVGHERTLLIGDLNVDPFDPVMVSSIGFNASMSRQVAKRGHRSASPHGKVPFFYNPMWSLYGDESLGPPGTYYRSSSKEVCYFWHAFDQVLVRPELVPYLPSRSVQAITSIGNFKLTNKNGKPSISDHLPILFEFEIPETSTT